MLADNSIRYTQKHYIQGFALLKVYSSFDRCSNMYCRCADIDQSLKIFFPNGFSLEFIWNLSCCLATHVVCLNRQFVSQKSFGTAPFSSPEVWDILRTSWLTAFTVIHTVCSAALVKSFPTVWPIWANPLDTKPVGCPREMDNITPTPLPSCHHPSSDLRLQGQHLSLVVCCCSTVPQAGPHGESASTVKPEAKGHY